ncbi:CNH domain-containing protein [Gorgonomyces haynaldii]|nr:CNH domain-containing protein [Gorgonomyces haynaldii]
MVCLLVARTLFNQSFIVPVGHTGRLRDDKMLYGFGTSVPNGVLTLLADCYASTCQGDCYSITCPRRIHQFSKRPQSWIETVDERLLDTLSDAEKTRQNAIHEIIATEQEFVQDLYNTIQLFVNPLLSEQILEPHRRQEFVESVFSNVAELHKVNQQLSSLLLERQRESQVVRQVGDIFLQIAPLFGPYIEYGKKQVFAKSIVDEERSRNPEFVKFLDSRQRLQELRKLTLETFLTKPSTRLGRYGPLLSAVLKKTPDNHPDKENIPKALTIIDQVLQKINVEVGKESDRLTIHQLDQKLVATDEERAELGLRNPFRKVIRKGPVLMKKGAQDVEVEVYLFDHCLAIFRKKDGQYKLVKKPIPLELLETQQDKTQLKSVSSEDLHRANSTGNQPPLQRTGVVKSYTMSSLNTFTVFVVHLGRQGTTHMLSTRSEAERLSWVQAVEKQKAQIVAEKSKFEQVTIVSNIFPINNKVNSSTVYKTWAILGTDTGLFLGLPSDQGSILYKSFAKFMDIPTVSQVEILEKYHMLLVLSAGTLFYFSLSDFDPIKKMDAKNGRKVSSGVSFFKQGTSRDMNLIAVVKSSTIETKVKVFEPFEGKHQSKSLFSINTPTVPLRLFKEFYIPSPSSSIHFLKARLCVGCTRGFQLVDLESLTTQDLLDVEDPLLEFVVKRDAVNPISIFRISESNFLICYNEYGFFIDKAGKRSRPDALIQWSGSPTSFSYVPPYIIAVDPQFIEIRNVDTLELVQVIQGLKLRSIRENEMVMDTQRHFQHVFRLGFKRQST